VDCDAVAGAVAGGVESGGDLADEDAGLPVGDVAFGAGGVDVYLGM
jgi:hypothetical protein